MPTQRISAVIPYYNNARTLHRCLQSFANEQTAALHEIVLVDDGSSLPAKPIVDSMSLGVPVRVLHSEHAGQSRATNIGIEAVTGDITLLTCADIVAVPGFVQAHAVEHEKAAACGRRVAVLGHIGYAPWLGSTPFLDYLSTDGPQFCFGSIRDPDQVDGSLMYSPNASVPTQALRQVGGFDEGFPYGFQDTDLGLRLMDHGVEFLYRRQAWAHHDHPTDVASFARRNRSIGHYMWRMAERYPNLFPKGVMRQSAITVVENPGLFEKLLLTCRKLEKMYSPGQAWTEPKTRKLLHSLYQQTVGCAFTQGVLMGDERIAHVLGFAPSQWTSIAKQYEATQAALDAAQTARPSRPRVAHQQALA